MPAWIRHHPVTALLIATNVAVFLLQLIRGVPLDGAQGAQLVAWGANFAALTLGDEPWRLLSSMFLHIGVLHLTVNMYSLLILGPMVERAVGSARHAALYLGAGLAGGLTSALWDPQTISAGASGAIMGLAGAYFTLLLLFRKQLQHATAALRQLGVILAINIGMGLVLPGIDNACHLGGLAGGAVLAAACVWAARLRWRRLAAAGITLLAALACWGITTLNHSDVLQFDRAILQLLQTEARYGDFHRFWLTGDQASRADQFALALAGWQQCASGMVRSWQLDAGDSALAPRLAEYCQQRLAQYRANHVAWQQLGNEARPDQHHARAADAIRDAIRSTFEPRAMLAWQRLRLVEPDDRETAGAAP